MPIIAAKAQKTTQTMPNLTNHLSNSKPRLNHPQTKNHAITNHTESYPTILAVEPRQSSGEKKTSKSSPKSESITRRERNDCQREFSLTGQRLMYRTWFPKACASIEQEKTFHHPPVWDCKLPETLSHSHFNCTIARLHLCVNHISTRMLLCYSASCQIVPKTVRPSQCRGETSLHNSVKCARAHFYPPREEQYRGAWVKVWFLAKCAILSGNWQLSQGNRESACINPSSLFAENHRWSDAPVHMFYIHLVPHYCP